ncbi:MAG: hypothetical protein KKA68_21090 [Gammaproteobacteria bacterium]|nr:hypothetical protein [Gammaproteobacteria bacterium]
MTPTLYVIEVRTGPRKWEPFVLPSMESEASAHLLMEGHKKRKPTDKFRVRRYVRAK